METQRGGAGLRLWFACVVAALVLAGCGGDDKPSREEFAAAAERVCQDLDRQSDELSRDRPESVAEIVEFAQTARRAARDAVERVRSLEVPDGEEGEKAREWQDAVEQQADEQLLPALDDLEKAAKEDDAEAIVEAAQRIESIEAEEADRLARELGAEKCAD